MASKKDAPQNEGVQVIKKKPRGGNSPVIGMNGSVSYTHLRAHET